MKRRWSLDCGVQWLGGFTHWSLAELGSLFHNSWASTPYSALYKSVWSLHASPWQNSWRLARIYLIAAKSEWLIPLVWWLIWSREYFRQAGGNWHQPHWEQGACFFSVCTDLHSWVLRLSSPEVLPGHFSHRKLEHLFLFFFLMNLSLISIDFQCRQWQLSYVLCPSFPPLLFLCSLVVILEQIKPLPAPSNDFPGIQQGWKPVYLLHRNTAVLQVPWSASGEKQDQQDTVLAFKEFVDSGRVIKWTIACSVMCTYESLCKTQNVPRGRNSAWGGEESHQGHALDDKMGGR